MIIQNELTRRRFLKSAALASMSVGLLNPQTSLLANPFGWPAALGNGGQGKKVGIIGLDTSHAVAFTKTLNAENPEPRFKGYRVVAAYPQGSKDIVSATERVPGYIAQVKALGVEIVDSIASLLKKVDVILLESNDGRVHLEQAVPVIQAGKTLFIDKPIAASYNDAKKIFELARQKGVPIFSSSSLRYMESIKQVQSGSVGAVLGADTYSPAHLESTHPDFYWYGIHGIEMLFAIMGTGCESVMRLHTEDTDVVVGYWADGRLGTYRGTRSGKSDYGGIVFGEKGNTYLGKFDGYNPLLEQIINFFESGVAPVSAEQTLEICAFIEAADQSKSNGGTLVKLNKN